MKALISLRISAGWSGVSLSAYVQVDLGRHCRKLHKVPFRVLCIKLNIAGLKGRINQRYDLHIQYTFLIGMLR